MFFFISFIHVYYNGWCLFLFVNFSCFLPSTLFGPRSLYLKHLHNRLNLYSLCNFIQSTERIKYVRMYYECVCSVQCAQVQCTGFSFFSIAHTQTLTVCCRAIDSRSNCNNNHCCAHRNISLMFVFFRFL